MESSSVIVVVIVIVIVVVVVVVPSSCVVYETSDHVSTLWWTPYTQRDRCFGVLVLNDIVVDV